MSLGCSATFIKYIFFILNFIFALGGIGLMWIGGLALSQISNVTEVLKDINNVNVFWVAVVIVGFFVFIVSFFGCFGAFCESKCSLMTYATFTSIIVLAAIIVGLLAFNKISVIEDSVEMTWSELWKHRNETSNIKAINEIQKVLKCCGNHKAQDYKELPPSCCPSDVKQCYYESAYSSGCSDVLRMSVNVYGKLIGYGAIILALIELLAIGLICYLKARIESQYERFV